MVVLIHTAGPKLWSLHTYGATNVVCIAHTQSLWKTSFQLPWYTQGVVSEGVDKDQTAQVVLSGFYLHIPLFCSLPKSFLQRSFDY